MINFIVTQLLVIVMLLNFGILGSSRIRFILSSLLYKV